MTITEIVAKWPAEITAMYTTNEDILALDAEEELQYALFEHYVTEMPYGTARARTGDPINWIFDHLYEEPEVKELLMSQLDMAKSFLD